MIKLLILVGVSMCLAYCSQNGILVFQITEKRKLDIPVIVMVIMLSLFCGLRTAFNDTELYIGDFKTEVPFKEFLSTPHKLTSNPLFYGYQSFFRHHISSNANAFLLSIAFFSIGSIIRFIRKYSENFVFSVLLFFALGLYISHLASMKQCLAIAILTYAVDALINKNHAKFFILVFIAMLFHTYAIFYIVLPFFTHKPWTIMTYITIGGVLFILLTFETTFTSFLEVAEDAGKNLSAETVIDNVGINPFRLAVFAVPPLLSFVFQQYLTDTYSRHKNVIMNMSILSFLIMCLGIFSAANLFGRTAIYFELGTIIMLPSIIDGIFEKSTSRFISVIASGCYLGFFIYSVIGFTNEYRAIGLGEFLLELLK